VPYAAGADELIAQVEDGTHGPPEDQYLKTVMAIQMNMKG